MNWLEQIHCIYYSKAKQNGGTQQDTKLNPMKTAKTIYVTEETAGLAFP